MNKQLDRLYHRLTVRERIPLLVAAEARGDDVESRRLSETSPIQTWWFSEHLIYEQALHVLALIYIGEQLDAAATYFFAHWRMDVDDERSVEHWGRIAQAEAYFFTANSEAWRRLCAELGVDANDLIAANHNGRMLKNCEQQMPSHAPSAETMQSLLRDANCEPADIVTVDHLLKSWRRLLGACTRHALP
jgi:hypothetical protein